MNIRVVKWGNSLGLRIPKALVDEFNLHNGSELDVQVLRRAKFGKQIVMRERKLDLDSLLNGIEQQACPEFMELGSLGLEAL